MSAITLPFLRSANTLAGADTPPVNVENVLTFEKQTIPNTQSESIPDTYRIVFLSVYAFYLFRHQHGTSRFGLGIRIGDVRFNWH